MIHELLKEGWQDLPGEEKETFRQWTEWDRKRHAREMEIFEDRRHGGESPPAADVEEDDMKDVHVPKKQKAGNGGEIPRKDFQI
jgi:hypothetical protein